MRIVDVIREGIAVSDERDDMRVFQERAGAWMRETFGERVLRDPRERALRVLEEAAELAQAIGLSQGDAVRVVRDVYGREPGEPGREVGGLMNAIGALCEGLGIDLSLEARREMGRVERPDVVGRCRRRSADKAARGVSGTGLVHNQVLVRGDLHDVTQAYAEGVIARRAGAALAGGSPYRAGDDADDEWVAGYVNAGVWDHRLPDGSDALDAMPEGRIVHAHFADEEPDASPSL